MRRTPDPLLPGDTSRKRGGGSRHHDRGKITPALPPSFESWGFSQSTLRRFERVLLALKLDLERQEQILKEEILSLEKRRQELISQRDSLVSKG